MDDSFEKNERYAREFPGIRQNTKAMFAQKDFQVDLDDKPTRDKPPNQVSFGNNAFKSGTFGGRAQINIDENDDTFSNATEFKKVMGIVERGQRLKNKMSEALEDDTWTKLHGPHVIPKESAYVPPFLQQSNKKLDAAALEKSREGAMNNLYEIEIEAALNK